MASNTKKIERGQVWFLPAEGDTYKEGTHLLQKDRPWLVISDRHSNDVVGVVTVVPLTMTRSTRLSVVPVYSPKKSAFSYVLTHEIQTKSIDTFFAPASGYAFDVTPEELINVCKRVADRLGIFEVVPVETPLNRIEAMLSRLIDKARGAQNVDISTLLRVLANQVDEEVAKPDELKKSDYAEPKPVYGQAPPEWDDVSGKNPKNSPVAKFNRRLEKTAEMKNCKPFYPFKTREEHEKERRALDQKALERKAFVFTPEKKPVAASGESKIEDNKVNSVCTTKAKPKSSAGGKGKKNSRWTPEDIKVFCYDAARMSNPELEVKYGLAKQSIRNYKSKYKAQVESARRELLIK